MFWTPINQIYVVLKIQVTNLVETRLIASLQ
jgi:hypothetical protein